MKKNYIFKLMEKQYCSEEKGITLVALVITIIVLLILAGVSIAMLTGENGILTQAQNSKLETERSEKLEKIELAVAAAQLDGKGKIDKDNLNQELRKNFQNDSIEVNENPNIGWTYGGYTILYNGEVKKLLPNEYQQVEYRKYRNTVYRHRSKK